MRRLVFIVALLTGLALPQAAVGGTLATTYPVGHQPFGVVVDPLDGRVYVSNNGGTTVSVVDPVSASVRTANAGMQPGLLALDSAARRLYVSNYADQTITVLDLATLSQVTTIYDGGGLGIAVDPAAHLVFAARGTEFVSIDTRTNTVLTFVSPSGLQSWFGVAVDPTLHRVYVTNIQGPTPTLEVLNESDLGVVAEIPLPKSVRFAFAVDASTHNVYLASEDPAGPPFASSELYVVDSSSLAVVKTAPLGGYPGGIALSSAKHRIYVADNSGRRLLELDDQTLALTSATSLPWAPQQLALHSDGRIYVAGNTGDVLGAVVVGNNPPVVDSVTLSPAAPRTNDTVQATVAAHDPDGDTVALSYQWSRNGSPIAGATGSSLDLSQSGAGDRGDTVSVQVTASDGVATANGGASVVVADTAPSASVSLSNTSPGTADVVTATAAASDADGDQLSYTFTWKVNGLVRKTTSGPNASDTFDLGVAGNGDRGDTLAVELVVSDGTLSSTTSSATAMVVGSAPTVTVSLNDATPRKKDTVVATAVGHDADLATLTFTWTWRVNGDTKRTSTGTDPSDSFDLRGNATNGDTVTVTVTANDGFATSAPATATATVTQGNAPGDR